MSESEQIPGDSNWQKFQQEEQRFGKPHFRCLLEDTNQRVGYDVTVAGNTTV